jgi:hypothetical protein
MRGAHEHSDDCGDESPRGPKISALTKTAPRQIRSEQPHAKDRPEAVSVFAIWGFDQAA